MKKIIAIMLIALHLLGTSQALAALSPVEAKITFLKGKAEVQRGGSLIWAPAMLRMSLTSGDRIATEEGSEVEIKLDDGSVLKMKDKSLLVIERMDRQKKPLITVTRLQALSGKILGCIRKLSSKESKFEINTPTAVAGIRGTVFAVFVEGDSTELDVVQGQVAVSGQVGREVLVGEKQSTVVAKGDSARSPFPMAAAKLAFIMMWGGAAIKIGSLGAASATAWYASTPFIVGSAAAVAVGTAAAVIISNQKDEPPPQKPATPIPNPPGWPQ